jgi:hypothetical protein
MHGSPEAALYAEGSREVLNKTFGRIVAIILAAN